MKKMPLVIIFLSLLALTGCTLSTSRSAIKPEEKTDNQQPLLGGDRDEHGCIGSAGYSWCEAKQKCLRIWEEKCEATTTDVTADWTVYKNEKYGFEMKFPSTWSGYGVNSGDYSTYSYVNFSFRGEHQPFALISIIRYTPEQWKNVPASANLKILSQTDEQTLVCDGCCFSDGNYYGGGQFDAFQVERCQEGAQIISTFRVIP
jgi:hypothetical protein